MARYQYEECCQGTFKLFYSFEAENDEAAQREFERLRDSDGETDSEIETVDYPIGDPVAKKYDPEHKTFKKIEKTKE